MNSESRSIAVNRLAKPLLSDHSCCNLACTDANSSGVHGMESSSFKVKNDKGSVCSVFILQGASYPFCMNRGFIGHAQAVHNIELGAGWVRDFPCNININE